MTKLLGDLPSTWFPFHHHHHHHREPMVQFSFLTSSSDKAMLVEGSRATGTSILVPLFTFLSSFTFRISHSKDRCPQIKAGSASAGQLDSPISHGHLRNWSRWGDGGELYCFGDCDDRLGIDGVRCRLELWWWLCHLLGEQRLL